MVPYSHLYDVDECSKFIADFIYYSPERYLLSCLDPPLVADVKDSVSISGFITAQSTLPAASLSSNVRIVSR